MNKIEKKAHGSYRKYKKIFRSCEVYSISNNYLKLHRIPMDRLVSKPAYKRQARRW